MTGSPTAGTTMAQLRSPTTAMPRPLPDARGRFFDASLSVVDAEKLLVATLSGLNGRAAANITTA